MSFEFLNYLKFQVNKTLEAFVEVVKATATKLPESRFAILEPMLRPGVRWYSEGHEELRIGYSRMIGAIGLINISLIKCEDLPSQIFEDDGVHLTRGTGLPFLNAIIYYAEDIFKAAIVDLEPASVVDLSEEAMEVTAAAGGSGQAAERSIGYMSVPPPVEKSLEEQLAELKTKMEERWRNDSLVFARIRDEMDALLNSKKEDRVVITSLRTEERKPDGHVEARQWLNGLIGAALDSLIPETSSKIKFINPGRSFNGEIPVCEVGFKDVDLAGKLRREFGNRRKGGIDTGKFFLSNSVTLGTRVRLEILRSIAKECSNAEEDFFAIGFTSRPVLQVKKRNGSGQFALTFVDAVVRYGGRVGESDLRLAYERAGVTFKGQMQQNFVVLSEKGVRIGGGGSARGRGGTGRPRGQGIGKRPLESNGGFESQSKKPAGRGGMGRGTPGN